MMFFVIIMVFKEILLSVFYLCNGNTVFNNIDNSYNKFFDNHRTVNKLFLKQTAPDSTDKNNDFKNIKNADTIYTKYNLETELEEIIIKAKTDNKIKNSINKTIYYNDANKILASINSGVFSIIPIYSRFRINNMDPKYTVIAYNNMHILMDNSQLHGGVSSLNQDIFDLNLHKTAYSSKYDAIGGVVEIKPKQISEENKILNINTNIIERSITYAGTYKTVLGTIKNSSSFRNVGIIKPLENIVEELKILPDIYEFSSINNYSLSFFENEIILRIAKNYSNFDDNNILLRENSGNTLMIVSNTFIFEDFKINNILSYELNSFNIEYDAYGEINNVKNFNENIATGIFLSNKNFSGGIRTNFLINKNIKETEKKNVSDIFIDYNLILKDILITPSIKLSTNWDRTLSSQAIKGTYFFGKSFLEIGYGHPVNMLVVDNSSGEKNYELRYLKEQFGDHYVALINIAGLKDVFTGILDEIELSYYYKYYQSEIINNKADKGAVNGIDIMLKNNQNEDFFYILKYSTGNATLNNSKMNEAIDKILTLDLGIKLSDNITLNSNYTYNNGYNIRIKSDKSTSRVGKSSYLSVGVNYYFELFGNEGYLDITLFNILRFFDRNNVPEFARYKIRDEIKSIKMPPTGDVRLGMNFKL